MTIFDTLLKYLNTQLILFYAKIKSIMRYDLLSIKNKFYFVALKLFTLNKC